MFFLQPSKGGRGRRAKSDSEEESEKSESESENESGSEGEESDVSTALIPSTISSVAIEEPLIVCKKSLASYVQSHVSQKGILLKMYRDRNYFKLHYVFSLTRTSHYLTHVWSYILDLFNSYFIPKQEPKSKRGRPAAVAKGRKGAVAKNASAKATPVKRKAPTPPGMYNSNINL